MKFLFDFFPIILFFAAFKLYDIFVATSVAIVATLCQMLIARWQTGRFEKTHVISFFAILILGGATLILHNEVFIKWKTTAIYWILGLIFLLNPLFSKKTIMENLAGDKLKIPSTIWLKLNRSWGWFFTTIGFVNLYVMYHFDTETWVNFKLFGILGLTLLFVILQAIYMAKHINPENGESKP